MDCPIGGNNIYIAEKIFGLDIHKLKEKTVRKKSVPVVEDYVQVPKEILKLHKNVTLAVDHMYVNGECFLLPCHKNKMFYSTMCGEWEYKHHHEEYSRCGGTI